jgi:dolichol-phosphate mannosyltransferase
MGAIQVVEGGRHPAVLDVPTGALSISSGASGAVKLSLVIPTFNESKNVEELVARLTSVLDVFLPGGYELIVVDDDSPDETWAVALRLADRYPALRVMRRRGEKGLSTAVIRGWQAACGEVLAVIDADLQHPPELVERLWSEIAKGADLATGSRHVAGGGVSDWSAVRRALSRGAQLLGLFVLPGVVGRVSDPMSGYFMVRRSAIAETELSPLGYKILIEVIGRGRIGRIAEVGYVFQERTAGESKVTSKLYLESCGTCFACVFPCCPPASTSSRPWASPASRWTCSFSGCSGAVWDGPWRSRSWSRPRWPSSATSSGTICGPSAISRSARAMDWRACAALPGSTSSAAPV